MMNGIPILKVKELVESGRLSIDQVALIFDISPRAVYYRFDSLEKGTLRRKHLTVEEIKRLDKFLVEFDEFVNSLNSKLKYELTPGENNE